MCPARLTSSTRKSDRPMTEIVIPHDLLPADGRFGCGPSKIRPEQLAALARSGAAYLGTSHRQAPAPSLVPRVRGGMTRPFSRPDGDDVLIGDGGTTPFF